MSAPGRSAGRAFLSAGSSPVTRQLSALAVLCRQSRFASIVEPALSDPGDVIPA
jgi:hypothetical protein